MVDDRVAALLHGCTGIGESQARIDSKDGGPG